MKWVDRTKDKWANAMALAAVSLALVPVPAWAQGMNQTQVDTMVTSILNVLTGPLAKGLAAIALGIAGYMFFFCQASKGLLHSIIIRSFTVFGPGWTGDLISGNCRPK